MDLGGMYLERRKRMDPAFSARREFPKNQINIDKFTGFFDKFLKNTDLVSDFDTNIYLEILASPTQIRSQK